MKTITIFDCEDELDSCCLVIKSDERSHDIVTCVICGEPLSGNEINDFGNLCTECAEDLCTY